MTEKWTVNNLPWFLLKFNVLMTGTYFGIDIVMWLYKLYANRIKRNEVNEVLFMRQCDVCKPPKSTVCDTQYCFNYTFREMQSFIDGARYSLYICMNVFTSFHLGEAVLRARERGVSVKIIANYSTAHATGSQLQMLHQNDIPVRFQESKNYVHHKFCLIDTDKSTKQHQSILPEGARKIPNNGVIMTGSMNWTLQAMVQNWENVMITSDKFIVDEFHKEFFAIWNHVHVVEFK